MLSLSTFLQQVCPAVFPRQLGGADTHLYTRESLEHLARRLGLEVVGEWWFGSDMVDLFRSLLVQGRVPAAGPPFEAALQRYLGDAIDELQLVLDRSRLSSEVHLVLRKPAAAAGPAAPSDPPV